MAARSASPPRSCGSAAAAESTRTMGRSVIAAMVAHFATWRSVEFRAGPKEPGRTPLPGGAEETPDLGDALLVAAVERPLADALGAQEAGLRQDAKVLACRRLSDPELLRDEQAADAVADQVARLLRRKVAARILE